MLNGIFKCHQPLLLDEGWQRRPRASSIRPWALFVLLAYDVARWCFPKHWHAALWRYEHIYKLISALFGMLSAATGNLIRVGQPWSQLLPSVLGAAAILWFFAHTWRAQRSSVPERRLRQFQ